MSNEASRNKTVRRALATIAAGALGLCAASCAATPETTRHQDAFGSPEAAVDALVGALRTENHARVEQILGPDGRDLIDSGDAVADRNAVAVFLSAFDRAHSIEVESDQATLVVGDDAWPLPIPVVAVNGAWRFDTEAGREEMLARRIGENELAVIQVCQAIVDAQREYLAMTKPRAGDTGAYAQKFLSSPGARDGLFWMTAAGEPPSPLGPLVADAVAEGYTKQDAGEPFHGYYYRMLTQQGSSAPGGAQSYLEDGRMTGGFAVVAWPASYENSGIMTFLVADQGVVFEKDLGPDTERRAAAITSFDPSSDWVVVAY